MKRMQKRSRYVPTYITIYDRDSTSLIPLLALTKSEATGTLRRPLIPAVTKSNPMAIIYPLQAESQVNHWSVFARFWVSANSIMVYYCVIHYINLLILSG